MILATKYFPHNQNLTDQYDSSSYSLLLLSKNNVAFLNFLLLAFYLRGVVSLY